MLGKSRSALEVSMSVLYQQNEESIDGYGTGVSLFKYGYLTIEIRTNKHVQTVTVYVSSHTNDTHLLRVLTGKIL